MSHKIERDTMCGETLDKAYAASLCGLFLTEGKAWLQGDAVLWPKPNAKSINQMLFQRNVSIVGSEIIQSDKNAASISFSRL